jgi:hypothetical protein
LDEKVDKSTQNNTFHEVVPAVYRNLPRGPVLEYPWSTIWDLERVRRKKGSK